MASALGVAGRLVILIFSPRFCLGVVVEGVVIRDRLPGCRVGREGPPARADPWVAVEGPHPDAHLPSVVWIAAEEVRSAFAAEALLEATLGVTPGLHELLPLCERERPAVDPSLSRGPGAGAALAAGAV